MEYKKNKKKFALKFKKEVGKKRSKQQEKTGGK